MKLLVSWPKRRVAGILTVLTVLCCAGNVLAANIGTVVPVVGRAVDVAYDEQRGLAYLANFTQGRIEVYSVGARGLINSIAPGLQQPASLAISPDSQRLYVGNTATGSFSVSVIDLNSQEISATYPVGSRPDAVAVGIDGLVLILGPAGLTRLDPGTGLVTPLPIQVPAVPPGLPNITPSPGGTTGMVTSASGTLIVGLLAIPAAGGAAPATGRLFVYDVASGTVLHSRNVTGLTAILSVAPDGSRFMAGPFLFDTQTLSILGRTGSPAAALTGGSAFSADGNSVYATFSTQTPINPLNPVNPQNPGGCVLPGGGACRAPLTLGVLQVLRASSLTPLLGLRLPELIHPKIVASRDGQNLFAVSTSGLMVIPVGQLNQLPVLGVSASNVVLSVDICNRTLVTAQVQVNNLGGGRMTFTAVSGNATAPVILNQGSGLAPTTLQITFNPRNVTTAAAGTQQVAIILVSAEAVNIEPAILVNLNFRTLTQRGMIVPMNGVGVDMQLDQAHQRIYIANYTLDQIEIFSLPDQTFLPPIRVGNRPLSMAMVNASTLVVANSGAESISVVDLDQLQEVAAITMGPIPLNATPLFPRSIAASSNAILFTAIPNPAVAGTAPATGTIWQLSLLTGSSFPRLNLGSGVNNVVQGQTRLVAPANGSAIVAFQSNGTLVLYDPIADTFPVIRTAAITGFRGTASATADGSYFLLDDSVFNSALGPSGTMAPVGTGAALLNWGISVAGNNNAVRVQPGTTAAPAQTLQVINFRNPQPPIQQLLLPEVVMDITPATTTATSTRLWPPLPTALELGVRGQTRLLPRGIVVDNSNTAYLLTISGLTIVSLTPAAGRSPVFSAPGVVNAASFTPSVAPGSLISIFGSGLAEAGSAGSIPLPTVMGGVCVTANEVSIPLLYTSPTQINAQLPPNLTGRITLAVRSLSLAQESAGIQVQLGTTAPGIFAIDYNGEKRAHLYHADDFSLVTPDDPAHRDEILVLYATGLGPVNPAVAAGMAAGSSPPSVATQNIAVTIGGHPYEVLFAGLAPGFVGAYQINIYVPGSRLQGDHLPVVVTAGSVSSSTTDAPVTSIH